MPWLLFIDFDGMRSRQSGGAAIKMTELNPKGPTEPE